MSKSELVQLGAIHTRIGQSVEMLPDRRTHRQSPKKVPFGVPSIAHPAEIIGYVPLLPSVKVRSP